MALTETALKNMRPADKTYTKSDERGLYIEVFPTGGMIWRVRYQLNGKTEKLTIGKYPALSLKNARIKRDEAVSTAAMGHSPAKQKQLKKEAAADETTVKEFTDRFFKEIQEKDRKDNKQVLRYFENDILAYKVAGQGEFGAKPMKNVTTEDVRSIIWRKKDHGHDAAAAILRGLLKKLCDYAVTCGLLQFNPVLALPMRHVHKAVSRERNLEPAEIKVFINSVYASNMRRQFKLGLHLLLLTMARKSELLLARWEHVFIDDAEWHIPVENSKTKKPHIVYLSKQAVALFKELQILADGSDLVMPGRGSLTKPFAHNAINNAMKLSMKGQEIPVFTVHDLRRTASTRLHENGWPSDVVEKALNHVIGGVRGVYNRAEYAAQRIEMLQFWADYIDKVASESNVILGQFNKAA